MKSKDTLDPKYQTMTPFYLVVLYMFLEYGRPQNLFPFLGTLHLPAITVILIGLSMVLSHKISLKAKQTVLFLLILCEMVIHGPFADNNYWAFWTFYNMSITFIAYLGIISFVDTYQKYDNFIKYWTVTFIFLAIVGITHKGRGVGGFIGDENDFCMALNMILPFVLFGVFMDRSKAYKIYCLILTCLFLYIIVLTQSRGGFLGLVSVLFYCVMKSNRKMALGMLIGVFFVLFLIVAPSGYWEEMGTISQEATYESENLESQMGTGAQRLYSWKLGWGMFLENPIMGVGQGNYPWHVIEQENKMKVLWRTRSLGGRAAHSLYFTLLPELGIIGAVLFFLMIKYMWKDLRWVRETIIQDKSMKSSLSKNIFYNTLAIEASAIGFLTSSVFISTLYYPNIWLLTAIMVSFRNVVSDY